MEKCIEDHGKGLVKEILPAKGDIEFHKTLALATHNEVLIGLFDDIYKLILGSVISLDGYKNQYKKALGFHKEIYSALKKKDKESAKEAMINHLDWLIEVINKS